MALKITVKENEQFKMGDLVVTVKKIRENRVELVFEGCAQTKVVGPHMLKRELEQTQLKKEA